jgi:hypothetical protein
MKSIAFALIFFFSLSAINCDDSDRETIKKNFLDVLNDTEIVQSEKEAIALKYSENKKFVKIEEQLIKSHLNNCMWTKEEIDQESNEEEKKKLIENYQNMMKILGPELKKLWDKVQS